MSEKTYKYYHEAVGYNNKRDLSRGISSSYLSEYGKQMMEQLIEKGINNVVSVAGLAEQEANKKIFIGFIHNGMSHPNANLAEVLESRVGDNFVYMVAYTFGIGGTPITQATEKITEKSLKGGISTSSAPVELAPISESSTSENLAVDVVSSSTTNVTSSLREISDDFRTKD